MPSRCPTCGEAKGHRFLTDTEIAEASPHELVIHFMPLAASLARRIRGDCEDTLSDAYVGLVKAAQNYDHKRGAKFVSLAIIMIRQSTSRGSSRQQGAIFLPPDVLTRLTAVKDAQARLGDNCTPADIAKHLGESWTASQVRHLLDIPRTVSTESIETDDERRSNEHRLADPASEAEFEAMLARNDLSALSEEMPADIADSISDWLETPGSQQDLKRIAAAGHRYLAGETML